MRKLIVGWDLDGCGYFFGPSVRLYLSSIGIEVSEPTDEFCKHWDFFEFWKMNEEDFASHCDDGVDAGIIFGPGEGLTRPNFFESMARVKEVGHRNVVVTHRFQGQPGNAERNTEAWLAPYRDLIDEIYYTKEKHSIYTDMFVEDNMGNYDKLIAAGTDAYLINRPWNGPYDDHRNRINDVKDFADAVELRTRSPYMV